MPIGVSQLMLWKLLRLLISYFWEHAQRNYIVLQQATEKKRHCLILDEKTAVT